MYFDPKVLRHSAFEITGTDKYFKVGLVVPPIKFYFIIMCLFFLYLRLYYHNYFITDLNKNDELYK
jgi:hypothetical protein